MRWRMFKTSRVGKRDRNEDFVRYWHYSADEIPRYSLLVACDGVGGRPNGRECSKIIGQAVIQVVSRFVHRLYRCYRIGEDDATMLQELLRRLPVKNAGHANAATTMVMLLYEHQRVKGGHNVLVAWAGDSRAQVLKANFELEVLTTDHHDEEGRINGYYTVDGSARGVLSVRHILLDHVPLAMSVTTDGVHERCTEDEWRRFLAYCLLEDGLGNGRFGHLLERFLIENISDNFSTAVMLRKDIRGASSLAEILGQVDVTDSQGSRPHVHS